LIDENHKFKTGRNSKSSARLTAARLEDAKSNGLKTEFKSERFNEIEKGSHRNSVTLSRANLAVLDKNS